VGGPVPILEGVLRTNSDANGTGIAHFSYSRTGSLVYLPGPVSSATTVNDLVLFDRKGASQPLKLPQGFYRSPRVSPDGKWVTFDSEDSGGATVWVYNLSGGTSIRRLTFGGKNRAPIWSADSQWVAFQSDREGDLAIFRQRADGSGAAERLTKTGAWYFTRAASLVTRRCVPAVRRRRRQGLHVMDNGRQRPPRVAIRRREVGGADRVRVLA
jgi:Tol biopolymer transport system component